MLSETEGFRCPPFAFQASEGRQEEEVLNTFQPVGLQAGGVKPAKLAKRYPEIGTFF